MAFSLDIGESAPDFVLAGIDGRVYSLADFEGAPALLVGFICNHCPHVVGSMGRLVALHQRFEPRGLKTLAINGNDPQHHPTDDFPHMLSFASERGMGFPYLRDHTQAVAWNYGAYRTPHFFLFDGGRRLIYSGRMDDNPKDPFGARTHELADAIESVLSGRQPAVAVTRPIGCTLKWTGRDQHWLPPEVCDIG